MRVEEPGITRLGQQRWRPSGLRPASLAPPSVRGMYAFLLRSSHPSPNPKPCPQFAKSDVNGPDALPLFGYLKSAQGGLLTSDISEALGLLGMLCLLGCWACWLSTCSMAGRRTSVVMMRCAPLQPASRLSVCLTSSPTCRSLCPSPPVNPRTAEWNFT